ncbi:glycosyltransferase family 2 protein [Parapedobacter koreensis]|uniref:Glycosyltransferase involved in cell wall bisynthesis n=1 Tax=Parapedobacter koreensis TaxID=332977 RepID=A0A1H7NLE7_9SPHI|nr:glycosyltransferase family 2 protein [Parapedobacter koreensis]SEL24382.1 Glycosyltransferase involved in cell wall bisynthesis [Parapedobacter koreensis]
MISVLILTKNEEQDIAGCLSSVSWCDDVHVLDSFSSDDTVDIARAAGARVSQRAFDGYASQRNAGLALPFKHEWVFILDADERAPQCLFPILREAVLAADDRIAGFRLRRRDFYNRRWLKHAQITPYYIRLVRKDKAHYYREVNEVLQIAGEVGELPAYFNHYPFSKGMRHWLKKHNRYSTMEAMRWIEEHDGNIKFSIKKALFSKDFSEKRYHQKGLFYKLPARPLIKWLYIVFFRLAILDGRAGLTYATLQAIYEYFIRLKTKELLRADKRLNGSLWAAQEMEDRRSVPNTLLMERI